MSTLPDLRTREAIQSYLRGLAAELGVSLGDPRLAAELDKRDKLAEFRSKFHVPIISDFLEKEERAEGGWLMVPNLLSLSLVAWPSPFSVQWNVSYPNFRHPNTLVNQTAFQFTVF